jgi:hypothetical protein
MIDTSLDRLGLVALILTPWLYPALGSGGEEGRENGFLNRGSTRAESVDCRFAVSP